MLRSACSLWRETNIQTAAAAAQALQPGHLATALRDDGCSKLPKLCTDSVLLGSYQTILTYLCPETQTPTATITVTKIVIITMPGTAAAIETSGYATSSISTWQENASTSGNVTTTTTIYSTMQVMITKTATVSSSSLTPAVITMSFPAVPLSEVKLPPSTKPTWSEFKNVSAVTGSTSKPIVTEDPFPFIDLTFLNLFPPHTPHSSSSVAQNSSITSSVPLTNKTSSNSGYRLPPVNVAREFEPTETVTTTTGAVTTTAGVVTTTGIGLAGESRVSFFVLFLCVVITALMF